MTVQLDAETGVLPGGRIGQRATNAAGHRHARIFRLVANNVPIPLLSHSG